MNQISKLSMVSEPIKGSVVLAFQGGAALVAYGAGVLRAFNQNPAIDIHAISTTSSAALLGAFYTEGFRKGGREYADQRILDCWRGATAYQEACLPLAYRAAERAMENLSEMPLIGMWNRAAGEMFQWIGSGLQRYNILCSPISHVEGFLSFMDDHGKGLDFSAIHETEPNRLIVNATCIPDDRYIHSAPASAARRFTAGAITPAALAASGSLDKIVPPVMINGERLRDGAYSENPHLLTLAELCQRKGYTLVVVRSRPTNARELLKAYPHERNEERCFFNEMLDRNIAEVRKKYPDVKIYMLEPKGIEVSRGWRMAPEFDFAEHLVTGRMEEGMLAGFKAGHPGIPVLAERRQLAQKQARPTFAAAARN